MLEHSLRSGNDGVYDFQRLADVINNSQPDLAALTEVDVGVKRSGRIHKARKLSEFSGMAVRDGPTQHYQERLYGNAVLTRLPILDVHIQPLPYTNKNDRRTNELSPMSDRSQSQVQRRLNDYLHQHSFPAQC